jgi:hypothetical protein
MNLLVSFFNRACEIVGRRVRTIQDDAIGIFQLDPDAQINVLNSVVPALVL